MISATLYLILVYILIFSISYIFFRILTKKPVKKSKTNIVKGSTQYIDKNGQIKQDFFEQISKHNLPE